MKFSGYLLLCDDMSAFDFGPDRPMLSAIHGPKVGQNALFNYLVLAVRKMGQSSKSGTLPEFKMVFFPRYFAIFVDVKKS